jgi:hypothetical protein
MKMRFAVLMLVTAFASTIAACSSPEKSTEKSSNANTPGGDDKPGAGDQPGGGGGCADECVAHEKSCGAPSPESFCQQTCTKYKPLAWEVSCAKKVECGDNDGLLACMPDLECTSKCVKHEKDCGDPSPDADCEKLCDKFRPTLSQTKCAQATECGDRDGLDKCMAPR